MEQDLPPGWAKATLGEIGEWYGGGTPSKRIPDFWRDGTIPWLSPKDMGTDTLTGTKDSITENAVVRSSARLVPAESVAMVTRSGVLEHSVPIAFVPFKTTLNQDMKAIVPIHGIDACWLAWALRALESAILRHCRKAGTTVTSLSTEALRRLDLLLPPLAEQRRIVDALEGHLSRLDVAVSAVKNTLSRSRHLRERITNYAANRSRWVHASAKPPAPVGTIDRDLPKIPSDWEWRRLGDIADVVGGVTKDSKKQTDPEYVEVPYLRVANVQRAYLNLDQVSMIRVPRNKAEQLRLRAGDVLLNEGGDLNKLGRGWVWNDEVPGAIHQNHVFRARIRDGILNPKMLSWHANSCARWFEDNGKQSVNLASISLKKIRMLPVAVPPVQQQNDIVAEIENRLSLLDKAITESERAIAGADDLRQSLLRHSFSGRLVPQDSTDEPASVLLERIRAERAAQTKPTKKRRPVKRKAAAPKTAPPVSTEPTGTYVQEELWA